MRTIAIIPARGGSKRVHNKNLSHVGGVPMLYWTLWACRDAGMSAEDVCVSTDNEDIARAVEDAGGTWLMRPPELASDTAPTEQVIEHALSFYSDYDAVMLLQCTSPLRGPDVVREALETMERFPSASAMTVYKDPGAHFRHKSDAGWLSPLYEGRPRTQIIEETERRENGALYITSRELWEQTKNRVGPKYREILMPAWQSVDVDTHDDLQIANFWTWKQILRRNSWQAKAMERYRLTQKNLKQQSNALPPPSLLSDN